MACQSGCRWEMRERIGEGGFADVYRGVCRWCREEVAIKVLTNARDPEHRRRFAREIKTVQGLNHANIIAFLGGDADAREPWYAMPLMRGGNLRRHCGRLDYQVVKSVMQTLAATIAYLHREGAIHRDIKPDNILIDEAGDLRLGDFGLGNDPRFTVAFTVHAAGTPGYAAPEVFEEDHASFEADVFSLGATFFHLLTGVLPGTQRDPRRVRRDVPDELAYLVYAMLEPARQRRPTIERVLAVLEGREHDVTASPHQVEQPAKGGVNWGAVAGFTLLALLIGGAAAAGSKR